MHLMIWKLPPDSFRIGPAPVRTVREGKMPTEIVKDQWNRSRDPDNVTWRMESFCYGPETCGFYKAGPKRKVRGRTAHMVFEDEGNTRST